MRRDKAQVPASPSDTGRTEIPKRFGSVRRVTARTAVGLAVAVAVGFFLIWLGFLGWLVAKALFWFAQLLA